MLFSALRNLSGRSLANALWAFTIYYSFSVAVVEGSGSDITVYMAELGNFYHVPLSLGSAFNYYIQSWDIDVLRIVLAMLVSRFTENGYVLIVVYGIIFGYFISRNIAYVLSRLKGKLSFMTIIFLVILFLINPIWNINGFRFWTAAQVFLYGLLPYVFERRLKTLLWCAITPFVFHFSFLMPVVVLTFYLFLGRRIDLYFVLFIISIFVTDINYDRVNDLFKEYMPVKIEERTSGYRTREAIEAYREGISNISWHAYYYRLGLKWSIISYLIVLYFWERSAMRRSDFLFSLFALALLFMSVANFASFLPSGGRFVSLASMLSVILIAVYIQNNPDRNVLKRLVPLTYPLLGLFVIVAFRNGFYQLSLMVFFGNPILAFFTFGENVSLNSLIR